jgi:hypothetical protein
MNDDTQQLTVSAVGVLALAAILAMGAVRCESEARRQETMRQCLQTQRPALECSAMVIGSTR